MEKEIITLFARYNKAANEAMNSVIKTVSPVEWDKAFGGFFTSVRSVCSHLYICDFNWLKRFKNLRSFDSLNDPFFDRVYSFNETLFPDMAEYFAKRPDLDDRILAFTAEINDNDLPGTLTWTDSHGKTLEGNFGGTVLRFLNHDTHHRGAISVYLDMLGKENDFSSLARAL